MDKEDKDKIILNFLNECGFNCDNINMLIGMQIQRSMLLDEKKYLEVQEHISLFKNLYSSSYLTSLQSTANKTQRWPLLNLVRQILKTNGYILNPKRLCDGYTKDGIKKYKRIFVISKKNI